MMDIHKCDRAPSTSCASGCAILLPLPFSHNFPFMPVRKDKYTKADNLISRYVKHSLKRLHCILTNLNRCRQWPVLQNMMLFLKPKLFTYAGQNSQMAKRGNDSVIMVNFTVTNAPWKWCHRSTPAHLVKAAESKILFIEADFAFDDEENSSFMIIKVMHYTVRSAYIKWISPLEEGLHVHRIDTSKNDRPL